MTNAYRWLTDLSMDFLNRDYLVEGQTLDSRVDEICHTAERILNIPGFAKRFKAYFQKGWYSFSTPIWNNFGNDRGLPISCFGSYLDDTSESIAYNWAEVFMMTKHGGGTSGYFGNLRERGAPIRRNGHSSGSVHFMQCFENLIDIVSQGTTRRGNFAAFLPVEHPDIMEFLRIRSEGFKIQSLSFGVTVTDAWMQEMIDGDMGKRTIWAKVLECRCNVGFPYIIFIDNANRGTVDCYKHHGMKISQSNLCTEIFLPNSSTESFVCDLSSMNDVYYDEWKDSEDAVELLVYFLDAVMTEFIEKAKKIQFMERAVRFAERHRALGIGQIGWHTYLQSKMIPFESMEAKRLNVQIAKNIKEKAYKASEKMSKEYGEPEVCKGFGRRHSTLLEIAPTKSSAWILGQASEAIEPHGSNLMIKDLQKGKYTFMNPHLQECLDKKGKNTPEIRDSILKNGGSVQHLDCLTDFEKSVFKTLEEISPKEIIIQAAQRQTYIDQGQSLNIFIHPSVPARDINALYIEAWRLGVKSLYYQYNENAAQSFAKNILQCASCEG